VEKAIARPYDSHLGVDSLGLPEGRFIDLLR
jgi:hypothetical protein